MSFLPSNNGFYSRNYRSSNLIDRLTRLGLSNANNIVNSLLLLALKSNQNALTLSAARPLIIEASSSLYNPDRINISSNNLNEEISILDSIKQNQIYQVDLSTSQLSSSFNLVIEDSISTSPSLYDLLQVLTESSVSGLTQVFGALNVSLGAQVERVIYNLDKRILTKCCISEIINNYLELDGAQESLDNFVVNQLGYTPLIIEDVVNSTRTIPLWIEQNEPSFRPIAENLLIGNLYEFFVETLFYQTGFNIDNYEEESIELKHLICSTFGLAVTSTTPCIPPQPIAREIPNVSIINAVSPKARVKAESTETGIRIEAISLPASSTLFLSTSEPLNMFIEAESYGSASTDIRFTIPVLGRIQANSLTKATTDIRVSKPTNDASIQAVSSRASVSLNLCSAKLYAGEDIYWYPGLEIAQGSGSGSELSSFRYPPLQILDATADITNFRWVLDSDTTYASCGSSGGGQPPFIGGQCPGVLYKISINNDEEAGSFWTRQAPVGTMIQYATSNGTIISSPYLDTFVTVDAPGAAQIIKAPGSSFLRIFQAWEGPTGSDQISVYGGEKFYILSAVNEQGQGVSNSINVTDEEYSSDHWVSYFGIVDGVQVSRRLVTNRTAIFGINTSTPIDIYGPITELNYGSRKVSDLPLIYESIIRVHGYDSSGAAKTVIRTQYRTYEIENPSLNITRSDGLPDNCGDPPPLNTESCNPIPITTLDYSKVTFTGGQCRGSQYIVKGKLGRLRPDLNNTIERFNWSDPRVFWGPILDLRITEERVEILTHGPTNFPFNEAPIWSQIEPIQPQYPFVEAEITEVELYQEGTDNCGNLPPTQVTVATLQDPCSIFPSINFESNYNLDKITLKLVSCCAPDLIYDKINIFTRLEEVTEVNNYISYIQTTAAEFTASCPFQHWRLPPSNQDEFQFINHDYFSWQPPENTESLTRYELQAYKTGVGWETIASTTEPRAQLGNQEYVLSTENYEIIVDEIQQAGFLVETSSWSSSTLLRIKTVYDLTWSYGESNVCQLLNNNPGLLSTSNITLGAVPNNLSNSSNVNSTVPNIYQINLPPANTIQFTGGQCIAGYKVYFRGMKVLGGVVQETDVALINCYGPISEIKVNKLNQYDFNPVTWNWEVSVQAFNSNGQPVLFINRPVYRTVSIDSVRIERPDGLPDNCGNP